RRGRPGHRAHANRARVRQTRCGVRHARPSVAHRCGPGAGPTEGVAGVGRRLVIEDDYDAEYRYDRQPLGALQGLAPDRVIYMGTVSKTLAPALRLGWLVLPAHLVEPVAEQRELADLGAPTLDQLALARLISSGAYDRHLRLARRSYLTRRGALIGAVER